MKTPLRNTLCPLSSLLLVTVPFLHLPGGRFQTDTPQTPPAPASLPEGVNLSTPLAMIDSFEKAFNRGDITAMAACVVRGAPETAATRMEWLANGLKKDALTVHFRTEYLKVRGDHASVVITAQFESDFTTLKPGREDLFDWLTMVCEGGRWRISPKPSDGIWALGFINELAQDFQGGTRKLSPLELADAGECQNHIAKVARNLIVYIMNHKEVPTGDQQKMLTWANTPSSFCQCPRGVPGKTAYRFNHQLCNKKFTSIADPAHTVFVYEANGPQPAFRHAGKAFVIFCDNKMALLSADQWKSLKWKVK